MIELEILNFVKQNLTVPVYMNEPEVIPEKYCVIAVRTVGCSNKLLRSTVAIQSYAKSNYEASALNETVKTVGNRFTELDVVTATSLNSSYDYKDTARKKPGYQSIFDIYHY